jgi:Flp pilus assembly protein TadG
MRSPFVPLRPAVVQPLGRPGSGQSLVEFALVLPILLLILFGIIQMGLLFASNVGLVNAVREAARYGSLSQTTETSAAANGSAVDDYLRDTLLPASVPTYRAANLIATSVTYCGYQNPGGGDWSVRLTVSATYGHPLFLPIVSQILDGFDSTPNALEVTSSERFRVENPPLNPSDVDGLVPCP